MWTDSVWTEGLSRSALIYYSVSRTLGLDYVVISPVSPGVGLTESGLSSSLGVSESHGLRSHVVSFC